MILPRARFAAWLAASGALLVVLVAWSLAVGRFPLDLGAILASVRAKFDGGASGLGQSAEAVLWQVRAPRIAAALAVGGALAGAGSAYQNLFRNPLVSPDILGVSAGCALGAVGAILLSLPVFAIQGLAFAGGIVAVTLVIGVGTWVRGHDPILTLVLTGIVVAALFGAGIAMAKYVADPYNQLPAITFWLLGSFAGAMPADLWMAVPLILVGLLPLFLLRWRINLLSLPDEEARSLGVDVGKLRLAVIAAATLATSASVALAGTIGWVGLVIPHAARMLVGAEYARVLPMSVVLGAGFLLLVDTLCRTVAPTELPPGIVTALIGTPAFIALLATTYRKSP